jgi:hypothetical protein
MVPKRLSIPEPGVREIAHQLAYKIARERLAEIKDIAEQCHKSGARYLPAEKAIALDHLNRSYKISLPDGKVSFADNDEAVPIRDKILILHYFTRARGTPSTGRLITYKELQEGINYYPTFFKRAIEPIISNFKSEPEKLTEIAATMGGRKSDYGDIAVTITAFPNVPLTIVLWRGDEEFPLDGNILFDSTIAEYLPTEDVTILCEIIAWRLVRNVKSGGENSGHR